MCESGPHLSFIVICIVGSCEIFLYLVRIFDGLTVDYTKGDEGRNSESFAGESTKQRKFPT